MDCSNVTNRIDEFREGSLSEGESSDIRQHLVRCDACKKQLSAAEGFDKDLRDAFLSVQPPSDFAARATKLAGQTEIARIKMRPIVWMASAAAACLVFAIGLNALLPGGRSGGQRVGDGSAGYALSGRHSVGRAFSIESGGRISSYRGRTGVRIVWNISENAPELVVDAFPGTE